MEHSVLKIPRPVRRRLKKLTQKPNEQSRRAHAILLLWETDYCVATVARGSCVQHVRRFNAGVRCTKILVNKA